MGIKVVKTIESGIRTVRVSPCHAQITVAAAGVQDGPTDPIADFEEGARGSSFFDDPNPCERMYT